MLFFQLLERCGHLRFEAVFLVHQSGKRRSMVPDQREESLLRKSRRDFSNVIEAGIDVESLDRVSQPHISAYQARLPIYFALDHAADFFVGSLAKNPLLVLE